MSKTESLEIKSQSKKKKFRFYDSYISKVLKTIETNNGITSNAKQQLNSVLIIISKMIANRAVELTEISKKRTLSKKEVENSVKIYLEGELQAHAVRHGNKSVNAFETTELTEKGTSRQKRAEIIFPPSIAEKFLRKFDNCTIMVTQTAPVYLASILEYLCMEILEQSVNNANSQNRVRLTVKDVELAIRNDNELNRMFVKNNIYFMGGSNIPHINPVLLHRKTTTKKKPNRESVKKHRFKPGTVSLREIRKLQKLGNTLIFARNPFEKYVRQIISEYNKDLKISKNVFSILQYALEAHLVKLLTNSNNAAIHTGRVKMMPCDIDFILKITTVQSSYNNSIFEYESDKDKDNGDESSRDELSRDESSREELSGDELSRDESSRDELSRDESSRDELSGDELSGDELSGDELSEEELSEED